MGGEDISIPREDLDALKQAADIADQLQAILSVEKLAELGARLAGIADQLSSKADEIVQGLEAAGRDVGPEGAAGLRRQLDTASGALKGFQTGVSWAPLIGLDKALVLGAGLAVAGGVIGYEQEDERNEAAAAVAILRNRMATLEDLVGGELARQAERERARQDRERILDSYRRRVQRAQASA